MQEGLQGLAASAAEAIGWGVTYPTGKLSSVQGLQGLAASATEAIGWGSHVPDGKTFECAGFAGDGKLKWVKIWVRSAGRLVFAMGRLAFAMYFKRAE